MIAQIEADSARNSNLAEEKKRKLSEMKDERDKLKREVEESNTLLQEMQMKQAQIRRQTPTAPKPRQTNPRASLVETLFDDSTFLF
jgi:chromosome segregation ATPase